MSQTSFQKTYGGQSNEYGFAICAGTNKGLLVAGYTDSYGAGVNDFFIIKTDSLGNNIWQKTYGGLKDDEAYDIKPTDDGGYIIAGYSKSFGAVNYNPYLVKINASGDTLWTKTYGGLNNDFANSIQQTHDGGFVLAGYTTTFVTGADSGNIYLIKTDALGNLKWTKSIGGIIAISDGYGIQETTDNGFIITGYTNSFNDPNGDVFLLKTDSLGNISWTKTYGSAGVDWGNSIKQTSDGGYIIAGSSNFDSTKLTDIYLIKTTSIGDTMWTKTYGGFAYDYGQSIEITFDGGYIITGYTNSYGAGSYDVYLIKTDANGNVSWSSAIGDIGDDEGNSVIQTTDGGYAISGVSNSFGQGDYDVYLIKTDANGYVCNRTTVATNAEPSNTTQANQTAQTYIANTTLNKIRTLLDTGYFVNNICTTANIETIFTDKNSLTVFPNPNNGLFYAVLLKQGKESIRLSVKNILGETVYTANQLNEINLCHLSNGTYFLQVQCRNENYVQKIIISK